MKIQLQTSVRVVNVIFTMRFQNKQHVRLKKRNDVKREKLANDINVSIRTIDVLVKRIREKISCLPNSKNFLLTSRGIGYKLEP